MPESLRPCRRIASMCSGHGSISVTSFPVRARWPPRYPPTAPAPTTAIRFFMSFLRSADVPHPVRCLTLSDCSALPCASKTCAAERSMPSDRRSPTLTGTSGPTRANTGFSTSGMRLAKIVSAPSGSTCTTSASMLAPPGCGVPDSFSGRMPKMTSVPGGSEGIRSAGSASCHAPMRKPRPPASSVTTARRRFIGGLPRKLATNVFAG